MTSNEDGNPNEIMREILVLERDMSKCINIFVSKVLKGINDVDYLNHKEKVYLSNKLIESVSCMENAATMVIEVVAKLNKKSQSIVYVTNSSDDTVSVIQISDNSVVDTIAVGNVPNGIVITPNGEIVYVTNIIDDNISVIQTSDNTVVDTITVGNSPHNVAITPDGKYIYVTNLGGNTVSVIQTSDNTVADTITVGHFPFGIAITPNGEFAYVANIRDDTVSVIQLSDNTVVDTIAIGNSPHGVAITPTTKPETINKTIENILKKERDILKSLSENVCKTLRKLYDDDSICFKSLVELSSTLIEEAAKKERTASKAIEDLTNLECEESVE
ncbi:YncE family protein [Mycoplasmatota bacterium]|nr:YncE family protein [Mycoplasmatota bacterium]